MTVQDAIGWYQSKLLVNDRFGLHGNQDEAARLALIALIEQEERLKNRPLTLEELREMDGEPVWVVQSGYESRWYLVDAFWKAKNIIRIYAAHGPIMAADLLLEDEARFYRRKPENGGKHDD